MARKASGVPLTIPPDIWQSMGEIRAQLDSLCPGSPTPMEEVLREMILHYDRCPLVQDEADSFIKRAKSWK